MQALIFCGIQASGKSSFYQQHFFNSHVRISMDLLRTRHREKLFLELCLHTQAKLAVDNTNPTAEERLRYLLPAKSAGYELVGYYFESTVQSAMIRNKQRTGKAQIPEKGIWSTHAKLEPLAFSEGFNRIFHVCMDTDFRFAITEQFKAL